MTAQEAEPPLQDVNASLENILEEPEQFLNLEPEILQQLRQLQQPLYKESLHGHDSKTQSACVLPALVLDDMEEEQIWQQIELWNNAVLPQLLENTSKMLAVREERLVIGFKEEENEEEIATDEEEETSEEDEHKQAQLDLHEDDEDEDETDEDDENENDAFSETMPKKRGKPSIVDDEFFKLSEMAAFLDAEDAKEMRKQKGKQGSEDQDGINYFDENFGGIDDSDEEEDANPAYKDFFAEEPHHESNAKKKVTFAKEIEEIQQEVESDNDDEEEEDEEEDEEEEEEDEEDEEQATGASQKNKKTANKIYKEAVASSSDDEDTIDEETNKEESKPNPFAEKTASTFDDKPKSSYEIQQERLQQRIKAMENEMLNKVTDKPWQLKGEIHSVSRPQNSLLEEVLEFEAGTRPAPIITEATTRSLEELIKQRIKDQAWDDVERKVKPVQTPQEYRKQLVLDQEKSKLSLAQVYEKEYQQQMEKLDPNHADGMQAEPELKEHQEIRTLMRDLFIKLDALSNFHFTPKPVAPEPKIVNNTPAIEMEEVAPVAVSDATFLAPEEIVKPLKRPLIGKLERTKTDKKRERRQKKQKQRAIHKALEEKDIKRQKAGIPLPKKEEQAKLLKKITKNRNVEKIKTNGDQAALKTSSAFFSKLQDSTSALASKVPKKRKNELSVSAKKLKL